MIAFIVLMLAVVFVSYNLTGLVIEWWERRTELSRYNALRARHGLEPVKERPGRTR